MPTANGPLHDHYRTVLDRLDEQIEALVADGKYFKSRLEQLEEMPEEVRELDERRRTAFDEASKLERRLAEGAARGAGARAADARPALERAAVSAGAPRP
jgi:chromosome segregation ATPase